MTSRFLYILIVVLFCSKMAQARGRTCIAKDLRDASIAPARSQVYTNQNGAEIDSEWCFAYAGARIVGQALGVAISPEHFAVQAQAVGVEASAPASHVWSGFTLNTMPMNVENVNKNGFCPLKQFDIAFQDFALRGGLRCPKNIHFQEALRLWASTHKSNAQETMNLSNLLCGPRMRLKDYEFVKDFNWSGDRDDLRRMKRQIDQAIDSGKWVSMKYDMHYVVIEGRTSKCEYIVQDSIPRSPEWYAAGSIKSIGQDYQLWPSAVLIHNAKEIAYLVKSPNVGADSK